MGTYPVRNFWEKVGYNTRGHGRRRPSRKSKSFRSSFNLEPLEPRLLLDADMTFSMAAGVNDLTLHMKDNLLQIINNQDPDTETQVLLSQEIESIDSLNILGTEAGDRLVIDFADPFSIPVTFSDRSTGDSDQLEITGQSPTLAEMQLWPS